MKRLSSVRSSVSTRALLAGLAASVIHPAFAEDIVFGELQLFDFDTFAEETRYGWSSGDLLTTDLDLSARVGTITGSRNAQITPAVKAWGVTIIPEIRADTRSGARLTTSLQATTGVELFAGVTVGGEGFEASFQAGPTLKMPDRVVAGQKFQLQGGSNLGGNFTFDPGLPSFDAGLDVILNGQFNNKFEYGLYPFAGYSVGEWNLPFDLDFNLFNFDFDLDLPDLNLNLPEFPDFDIPGSEEDTTLFRQKLPPNNPLLSIAELAISNPLETVSTTTEVTDDGRLTSSTTGELFRAGLDIDGITSAIVSGGFSFTGTSVKIGPGKLGYDIIDVKYGLELGIEYETEVDPFINATLDFVDENGDSKSVLIFNEDGSSSQITSWSGRWDELPELALITREDVFVDVDFTDIEAMFSHTGALTLSDYMELQALKAYVNLVPGVKLVDIGPAYYQKFPLAGELAAFELFDASFSLGSLELIDGLWDGQFVIEAAPVIDVALSSVNGSVKTPGDWIDLETGTVATDLADKTLVIGTYEDGDMNRLDVTPVGVVDDGTVNASLVSNTVVVTRVFPDQVIQLPTGQTITIPGVVETETRTASTNITLADDTTVMIDGLALPEFSSYVVADGGARRFNLNYIDNDGTLVGLGHLGLEANSQLLTIAGKGDIYFDSAGEIKADILIHGEGHRITFAPFEESDLVYAEADKDDFPIPEGADSVGFFFLNGELITPPDTASPLASQHVFDVGSLDNAGTIEFGGSDFSLTTTSFLNTETGTIRVVDGRTLSIDSDLFGNSGRLEAAEAGSVLELDINQIGPWFQGDPNQLGGITAIGEAGEIVASNGGTVRLDASSGIFFGNQTLRAADGGTVDIDSGVLLFDNSNLITDVGGTTNLNANLFVQQLDGFEITNAGTLNINSFVSLIPDVTVTQQPGEPLPIIEPIGLTNTGTVNIASNGTLVVGAVINNFANDGAVFAGGTWNLNGADGTFSNLVDNGGAELDMRILGVENEDADFLAFFETFDVGLADFDTTLKTNAANVRLNGNAYFPYFNTVENNVGELTISGGHQFTTATGYNNIGGTTTVETGGDLFVQGALRVIGGEVSVDASSTLTAQTQAIVVDDEGNTEDLTVEVLGGTLSIANPNYLTSTGMFTNRTNLMPEFNYMRLEAGQVWVVREQVLIDPGTDDETVTPGVIDLGNAAIERNDGMIIIDGANARFDAAERMRYNHGTLILQGGFEFNTLVNDFRNVDEMILEAASFIVEGDNGAFRNDGSLIMDGDSYLFASQFINGGTNGPDATLQLDGVLDAQLVTINAGSTITGSGMITGSIINNGTLDLGNSPGLIETFGSYTQGAEATALFEIDGLEAGTSYDQLIVRQVEPVVGEEQQPDLIVTLGGTLSLVFAEDLNARFGFEWLLIDNQGDSEIIGEFDPIDLTGLTAGDPLNTGGVDTTGDLYLGDLGELSLFLTYTGGDGNDLTVYAVPEPSSLMLVSLGGLAMLRRRRRMSLSA